MICTRCGAENDDETRFCQACGHKLRSRERSEPESGGDPARSVRDDASSRPVLSFLGGREPSVWRKLALAWVLGAVLGGAAIWAFAAGVYWPLYPATLAAAVLAWRQRL